MEITIDDEFSASVSEWIIWRPPFGEAAVASTQIWRLNRIIRAGLSDTRAYAGKGGWREAIGFHIDEWYGRDVND